MENWYTRHSRVNSKTILSFVELLEVLWTFQIFQSTSEKPHLLENTSLILSCVWQAGKLERFVGWARVETNRLKTFTVIVYFSVVGQTKIAGVKLGEGQIMYIVTSLLVWQKKLPVSNLGGRAKVRNHGKDT